MYHNFLVMVVRWCWVVVVGGQINCCRERKSELEKKRCSRRVKRKCVEV